MKLSFFYLETFTLKKLNVIIVLEGDLMSILKKKDDKLDIKKVNDVVSLSKRILKIAYVLFIIVAVYVFIILSKELKVMSFLLTVLKVVSPLFIGIVVAWLFNPFVTYLQKKGIRRVLGTTIAYLLLIGGLSIVLWSIIPTLSDQINDFAKMIPQLFDKITNWIDAVFDALDGIQNFDALSIKNDLFKSIEAFGNNLTSSLPSMVVNALSSIFSALGIILVGLIIGFYLLIGIDGSENFVMLLPKKMQNTGREVLNEIDGSFRSFVQGAFLDCTFVFIITSACFYLVGLKAPLFFGLFCGITNIIPYAGPYIGGIPAVVVGFSQGIPTGILTLVSIFVIQFLEGNFLQPLIMSKTTKLHPVTIMLGLLVFGYFWGIIGMVISTPIIAAIKAIIMFLDEKYDILSFND